MAIDTAKKRSNVAQYGRPFMVSTPSPDGSVGGDDRAQMLSLYYFGELVITIPPGGGGSDGRRGGMSYAMSYDASKIIIVELE